MPIVIIVGLSLLFIILLEQSNLILRSVRFFLGDTFGTYYIIIGLGIFLVSIYLCASKYGDIVIPYCLSNYLDAYCKDKDKDNYLLTNNKVLMDQKTLQRGLNMICDKLGFEITYQGLRNTFK